MNVSTPAARKPKLLVITSTFPRWESDPEPGFVFELAKRMTNDFEVTVLSPHAAGAERFETLSNVDIVRYRYAPAAFESLVNDGGIIANLRNHRWKSLLIPSFLAAQAYWILHILRSKNVEVVHAHWILPQGFLAVLMLRLLPRRHVPVLITSHGADLFALRSPIMRIIKRFVLKYATAIAIVSPGMKPAALELGADPLKLRIEPMGVDLSNRFTPDRLEPRSTDEILFVGRIVEKKGLRHLIDAMPLVLAQKPNAYLTVAGFGPELENCKNRARDLGISQRVHFKGAIPQSELPVAYRRAAVFAAPFIEAPGGDQDGLGLVLIEALGCGCPVVVSDIPATRALPYVSPSIIVRSWRSPQELADMVIAGMNMDSGSPTEALHAFDWSTRAASYISLLNETLGNH